jgi:hypothetical protein
MDISFDVSVDDGISNFIDVVDDSIPLTEGIPSHIFRWSEATPIEVCALMFFYGGSPIDR